MLSLAEALAVLPDAADDVAAFLLGRECLGVPQSMDCCPVANYLTGLGFDRVEVDAAYIEAVGDDGWNGLVPADGTRDFVARFDEGDWPELVLDDTAEPDQTESTTTPLER